jgi:Fibronectin type III domain
MLVLVPSAGAETVGLPGGAATGTNQSDQIWQVSCPAAGDCIGVGGYKDTGGDNQALIDSENGGAWSSSNVPDSSLPNAGAPPGPYLTSVSCTSIGNCVAGDTYLDGSGNQQGLIDTDTGGAWTPIEAPLAGLLGGSTGGAVVNIACPAAGACVGAGSYLDLLSNPQLLIEIQSPGGWSATQPPLPLSAIGATQPSFANLACASVGNCAAVGSYIDVLGNQQGLLESDDAGSWSGTELDLSNLSPAADPSALVSAVSCPTAGTCTAVGTFQNGAGSDAAFEVYEVGGQWQQATALALPSNASTSPVTSGSASAPQSDLFVNAVSCASAGNCTAVGSYDATAANEVAAVTWTDSAGTWGTGSETNLPSGQPAATDPGAALDSVTCQSAGSCLAAGTYMTASGADDVVVARQTGSNWSTAGGNLGITYDTSDDDSASVSCAPGGYCAVGGYAVNNSSGHDNAFMLDAPAAVAGLSATLNGSQASVSWGTPADNGGLGVGGYTVTANDLTDRAAGGQSTNVVAPATSATLSGLASGDTYTFTVSASSLLGLGLPLTSGQVSAASPHTTTPPTRAQLRASLSTLLRPRGTAARLRHLRRSHTYHFHFRSLEAGRLMLRWYEKGRRGHHPRRLFAGAGTVRPGTINKITITVRLNRTGRRLVEHEHRLRLVADVSFRAGNVTVSRSAAFALS